MPEKNSNLGHPIVNHLYIFLTTQMSFYCFSCNINRMIGATNSRSIDFFHFLVCIFGWSWSETKWNPFNHMHTKIGLEVHSLNRKTKKGVLKSKNKNETHIKSWISTKDEYIYHPIKYNAEELTLLNEISSFYLDAGTRCIRFSNTFNFY